MRLNIACLIVSPSPFHEPLKDTVKSGDYGNIVVYGKK
jgi:hypothetical protein